MRNTRASRLWTGSQVEELGALGLHCPQDCGWQVGVPTGIPSGAGAQRQHFPTHRRRDVRDSGPALGRRLQSLGWVQSRAPTQGEVKGKARSVMEPGGQPQQGTEGLPLRAFCLRVTSSSLGSGTPAEPGGRPLLFPGQDWFRVPDSCLQLGRAEGQRWLVLVTHLRKSRPTRPGVILPSQTGNAPAVKVVRCKERATAFVLLCHVLRSPESAMLSLLIWGSHSPKLLTNRAGRPQSTAAPRKTRVRVCQRGHVCKNNAS